ncbi:T9SS-dependent choice-of-anchor J family protein [Flavobacterium sp. AG291]|uniref:T9SS-dependent choice-of-anchor J family protein n=1 Tax=Flavobacterium sp. AG291 TaxID=2184000 RepID=UPI000E0AF0C4|nr:choice-of-anchor J domain-containing protein [Flavobacterium sp. AG291]RDI12010.1 putative repeat protein (TIGR01451 family)/predicted secreted protein (Por secretion system target) [Flavobacterium sp. AG291]
MKKTLLAVMAMVSLCGYAQQPIEGFESPWVSQGPNLPLAPPGWIVINQFGPAVTWVQSPADSEDLPAHTGSYAAYLNKENVAVSDVIPKDWLISPAFEVTENAQIRFYSRLMVNGDQGGIYKVYVGTDPADLTTFTAIYTATEFQINPIQTDYTEKFVTIPSNYAGQQVHIAFVMEGDNADRWLLDDVGIFTACNAPTAIVVENIDLTSAEISWTETGTATQWEIEVVPVNVVPTGWGVVATANPFVVTGLSSGAYKVYVRAVCEDGGMSAWSGPQMFYTDEAFDNTVTGTVRMDANGDTVCNEEDTLLGSIAVSVSIDGVYAYTAYTDANGEYVLYGFEDGVHTLTLTPSIPGFPEFPSVEETVEFTDEINEWSISHCLPEQAPFNNLGVNFYTYSNPRPGFNIVYFLTVKNWANSNVDDVAVSLEFDSSKLEFISEGSSFNGVVSGNTIAFTVGDVAAFQQILGNVKFYVKQPPVNIGGEVINFNAELSVVESDIDMTNNTIVYEDVIVNSYDPNDITVHEGAKIYEEQVNDYLTYTIRFQNTGTAEAINIKLENELDELLDWETFQPIASSHGYTVKRTDNLLEFEYKDIFLPDSTSNEPGSHGHITYRIKPKAGFGIGDIVSNTAEIYFDFNEAIVTNTATTEVVEILGLNDNALRIAKLYPNPVKDQLHVEVAQGELMSVNVYDINGRLCFSGNDTIIDTYTLKSGIYFVKVTTDAGSGSYKLIKH